MTKQKSCTIVQSSNSCVWKGSNGPSKNSCKNLDPNPPKLQVQTRNQTKQTGASSSSSEKRFLPGYFQLWSSLAVSKIRHYDGTLEKLPSRVNWPTVSPNIESFLEGPNAVVYLLSTDIMKPRRRAGEPVRRCRQRGTAGASRQPGPGPQLYAMHNPEEWGQDLLKIQFNNVSLQHTKHLETGLERGFWGV